MIKNVAGAQNAFRLTRVACELARRPTHKSKQIQRLTFPAVFDHH
jgi:hypothetical protein